MVDDNYKGAETDKEATSDWGGGGGEGLGKSKTNIRAQRTKSHERAMRTIKKIGAELGHPRNIFERDRKPPPPHPSIPWIN